jgi:hypothetical protein
MPNEFPSNAYDGLEPDKQTPRTTKYLGKSGNKWDEVHAVSGNFTDVTINGESLRKYTTSGVVSVAGLAITHNLRNAYPIVQVYDLNGTGIPQGSGSPGSVTGEYVLESSGVNTLYLYGDDAFSAYVTIIG